MFCLKRRVLHLLLALFAFPIIVNPLQLEKDLGQSVPLASVPSGCSEQAPPEFVAWARKNAIPIATTEPGSGFKDLEPLRGIIGNARVVGLGESEHTIHEFYRVRHRLLEFLVERMGFTAFAMETGFAEAVKVNDYVLGRVDEPGRWQHNGFTWGFGYEDELVALLHWMRRYNDDPRHTRKLHFYGIDVAFPYSSPLTAVEEAQAYLDKVDPGYAASPERQNLSMLVQRFEGSGFSDDAREVSLKRYVKLPSEQRNAYTAAIADLLAKFRLNRPDYIARSSVEQYEWAYHSAVAAEQLDTAYRAAVIPGGNPSPGLDLSAAGATRDRAMADNILWALQREGARGRIVVWAHNSHLMKSKIFGRTPRMGLYLDSMLGHEFVNVGFTYYQRQGAKPDWETEVEQKDVNLPARCGTLDGELARVGQPLFVVNLHTVPRDGPVHDWLSRPQLMRETVPKWGYQLVPLQAWDALFFVRYITSAHGQYKPK